MLADVRNMVPSYGIFSRLSQSQAIVEKRIFATAQNSPGNTAYSVKGAPVRTIRNGGLSAEEIERQLAFAMYCRQLKVELGYVVLGDELLDLSEADARDEARDFTRRIVRDQGREGLPQGWMMVWEVKGGLHANVVFPTTQKMLESLRSSERFAPYLKGPKAVQAVDDIDRLMRVYLSGERGGRYVRGETQLGPRKRNEDGKQSFWMPPGGGDRVVISPAFRTDMVRRGCIEPWQRTTAKNLDRTKCSARLRGPDKLVTVPAKAETPWAPFENLFAALPEVRAPEPIARSKPRPRLRLNERRTGHLSLLLPVDGGLSEAGHAAELLVRIGLPSRELAARLGVSASHVRNLRCGRYTPSPDVAHRILKVAA